MIRRINIHAKFLIAACVMVLPFLLQPAFAQGNELGLESKGTYDIYIGNNRDQISIIKNVQVMGLRQVANKNFVVVQTDDFVGKRSEGLISLESIQAILPSFRITPSSGIQQIQSR